MKLFDMSSKATLRGLAGIGLMTALVATPAHAASTDVVFLGGIVITSTQNCNNWNPNGQIGTGSWFVPVKGSTNGTDSTLTFHFGLGGEGFNLSNRTFSATYQDVLATHVFTRTGTYAAQVKVDSQVPKTITRDTQIITVVGSVKGWDRDPDCVVNFTLAAPRVPNP